MATTNLLNLGRVSLRRLTPLAHIPKRMIDTRAKIIKKAIYTHCSADLADKAINGFRRSADDDAAVETDFKRTDLPEFKLKRDYHYRRALRVCEKLFRPSRTLHPVAFPDLRYYPWTLNTSAEAPFTTEKKWLNVIREKQRDGLIFDGRLTFHNLYDEIFTQNRQLVHYIKDGLHPFFDATGNPIPYQHNTLHARSHLVSSDEPDKIRAVFGVPKLLLQVENMFIWPLQKDYLNNKRGILLWGYETIRGGWKKLYNKFSHKRIATYLSIDWSQFDRRALHEVIDDIHDMWRNWFDFTLYEPTNFYPDAKTDPSRIENLWKWMCDSIKHNPIVTPLNNKFQWQYNGIASGFQQTQILDSFYNAIMILTCLSSCGINIESENFELLVQGDDSLFGLAELFLPHAQQDFLDSLAREALSRFNAKLNAKKSAISNDLSDVPVLSYSNRNGIAYRDPASLLAHLLYPEHPQPLDATISSCIGIAQANMGCSKEVWLVCQDVYNFLTTQFKLEARSLGINLERKRRALPLLPKFFPSFEETFLQNYDLHTRTVKDNERLWPTEPSSAGGFYFLKK